MIHASAHPEGNARGTLCAATHWEPAALASEQHLTMPSARRIKVVAALIAVVIFCLYYFSVRPLPLGPDQAPKLSTPFGELQNDPSTLSSSDFYSRTVAAMDREAQRSSHVDPATPAKHDTMNHKANQVGADGKVNEPPPIPPAKGQEHEAVLVAPDDKSLKPDKPDAKGVAGRKKYMGGENWDVASGKQAPIGAKRKGDEDSEAVEEKAKESKAETEEEHEIEVELNAILKKGPSESTPPVCVGSGGLLTVLRLPSHHLFEIHLPLLHEGQIDPPGKVHHRPYPLCRRAGRTSPWARSAGGTGAKHRQADSPECANQREEHWRRR